MYTVNTSFMVEPKAHERWYALVYDKYIPSLKAAGFGKILFTRVISAENTGHHTYSLQVEVEHMGEYKQLTEELFVEYSNIAGPTFGEAAIHFTTLLKHIEL